MAEKVSSSDTARETPPPPPARPSNYGTPVEGSKTEQRARKAHERVSREIVELCEIIGERDLESPIKNSQFSMQVTRERSCRRLTVEGVVVTGPLESCLGHFHLVNLASKNLICAMCMCFSVQNVGIICLHLAT